MGIGNACSDVGDAFLLHPSLNPLDHLGFDVYGDDMAAALLEADRRLSGWVCVTDGADGTFIANNGQIETFTDSLTTATTKPIKSVDKPVTRDGKGRIFGADNTDARLVLSASERVWVRIEDGKGKTILVDTLNAGDRFKVPNQEGLVVIARDGGLLAFEIDGRPGGTLGNPGEVLVNRTLDIDKLMNRGS